MSEAAARTLGDARDDPQRRPGLLRTVFWVCLSGAVGCLLAAFGLAAPGLLGVATVPFDGQSITWYAPVTPGALLADLAIIGVFVWVTGLCVRAWLGRFAGEAPPAWTWTALTLGAAGLLVAGTSVTTPAGGILAGLALPFTAYRADGTVRPEPLSPPTRGSPRASDCPCSSWAWSPPTRSTTRSRVAGGATASRRR